MKNNIFKASLERAAKVDIFSDEFFNYAGFWWLDLTERQCVIMIDLMKKQGCPVGHDSRGEYVSIKNGMRIYDSRKEV